MSQLNYEKLINLTSEYLSNEKAIGWFQGRMEFGPRALGGRSILGDPRSDKMQKNLKFKSEVSEKVLDLLHHQFLEKIYQIGLI
jgi:carbamoyltransferase